MGLWVYETSTSTFLSDVGHITHTCTQHSPSSVSPSIHHAPPFKGKLLLACIVVADFSATDRLPRSYPSSNRSYDTIVGSWGEPGGQSTSRLEQPHKWERHHTLTQNLKVMSLWVFLLIMCSTFIFLSDVGHITHTCTQENEQSHTWMKDCSIANMY